MFSKACEYAIKATLYVAKHSEVNKKVGLKEIAKSTDSPEAYTAKILQQLTKGRILESAKGPNGGFYVDETKLKKVKLLDIVKAIDGDGIYNGCGLGLSKCNAKKPCPVHYKFVKIRTELKAMLESTNIRELTDNLIAEETYLKR